MPSLRPHFTPGVEPAAASWRHTDDAAGVHAIHTAVHAQAPAGMVRADPLSHFVDHVDRLGVTIGCHRDDGRMIGYGVLVHGFALMYAGLPRLIVQRELRLVRPCFESVVAVRLSDHAAHQAALSQGLIGHACRQDEGDNWRWHYGRASQTRPA